MKIMTKLVKTGYNSHYIPIPIDVAQKALDQFGKRVLCTVNENSQIHCAIQRHKDIGYYITVGKNTKAKIDVESETIFSQLTPGFQRSIIHYVDAARRIETRIDRALKILNRLKMGIRDRKELFR